MIRIIVKFDLCFILSLLCYVLSILYYIISYHKIIILYYIYHKNIYYIILYYMTCVSVRVRGCVCGGCVGECEREGVSV